jgi:hypothetical protein
LRGGFLTEAAANRASIFKMQDVIAHKSVQAIPAQAFCSELIVDFAYFAPRVSS